MDSNSIDNYDLDEIVTNPYDNFADDLSFLEEWTRWGQNDFKKPELSDIWITSEFNIEPDIHSPAGHYPLLDYYDLKPVFSVVSQQCEKLIPSCVQAQLIESNVINNVLEASTRKYLSSNDANAPSQKYLTSNDASVSSQKYLTSNDASPPSQKYLTSNDASASSENYLTSNDASVSSQKYLTSNGASASSQKYLMSIDASESSQKYLPTQDVSSQECLPGISHSVNGQSGHSLLQSFENLAIAGGSTSSPQHKEVVYVGNPIAYRKPDEVRTEKNGKDRKSKKALKQQKKKKEQCIVMEETRNDLNHVLPLDVIVPKRYTLNISQPSNEAYSEYAAIQKSKADHEFLEYFCSDNKEQPINLVADFPALASSKLSATNGYVESSSSVIHQHKEPLSIQDELHEIEGPCYFLVIENIPPSIDDKELNDFIMTFGDIVIVGQRECRNMLSITLKVGPDLANAQWIAECMNGQSPFGACSEPITCYIANHTNGF